METGKRKRTKIEMSGRERNKKNKRKKKSEEQKKRRIKKTQR